MLLHSEDAKIGDVFAGVGDIGDYAMPGKTDVGDII
jgi:hypothetical protein